MPSSGEILTLARNSDCRLQKTFAINIRFVDRIVEREYMSAVEKAKINDAPQIHRLVNSFAERGEMLARPLSEIYENIRDYFVVRKAGDVVACAALHIAWA